MIEKVFDIPEFIKLKRKEKAVFCKRCWCDIVEGQTEKQRSGNVRGVGAAELMKADIYYRILTKTPYEHLVAAVEKMLEEGKKAGQRVERSNMKKEAQ
ncbi:MAG: hypothetical protein IPN90_07150 [Elusimicrobia bacterium]|nr:hypothetical protein [Elusimicrobiota bacterium]